MLVRRAVSADAAAIAEVHVRTWQSAYTAFFDPEYLKAMDRLLDEAALERRRATLEGTEQTTFVAEEEGIILGFATIAQNRDGLGEEVGELGAIYVHPEAWNKGVGAALLTEAERYLATEGFDSAILWTLAANQRTRRFYESNGWTFDGLEHMHEATQTLRVRYAKSLPPSDKLP